MINISITFNHTLYTTKFGVMDGKKVNVLSNKILKLNAYTCSPARLFSGEADVEMEQTSKKYADISIISD